MDTTLKSIGVLAIAVGAIYAGAAPAAEPQLNKYVDSYAGPDPARREAGAARQEARRGELARGENAAEFERNRLARCEGLPGDEKSYCIRRMNGEGTISGSVEGGGISRELRVTVPAERK